MDLQTALALEPEHTDALLQLGAAYEKLGSLQHAYDTLSALIKIDPNNAKALYARGACLNLMGQDAKALGMLILCILGTKSALALRSLHDSHLPALQVLHMTLSDREHSMAGSVNDIKTDAMAWPAEDYALALEKDKVQERLLLRRSNKTEGSASQSAPSKSAEESAVSAKHLEHAQVFSRQSRLNLMYRAAPHQRMHTS